MRRRALAFPLAVLLAVGVALAGPHARGEDEPTLVEVRRQLMFATSDAHAEAALDALTARIGAGGWFADHGAFARWLGELPSGRSKHPLVLQRRGWAHVRAKEGAEAIAPLEAALRHDPSSAVTRAYLGEALRQAGRLAEAVEMLGTAFAAGDTGTHVRESAVEAALALRRSETGTGRAGSETELPRYAQALEAFLAHAPDRQIHLTLAAWLLADLDALEGLDTERGRRWGMLAARHAHAGLEGAVEPPVPGSARIAFDAARAIEGQDLEREGDTPFFGLLAHACRLGQPSPSAPHEAPSAYVMLGEAAAREGRFELAARLARQRLEISDSPRARRLLDGLPPDLR